MFLSRPHNHAQLHIHTHAQRAPIIHWQLVECADERGSRTIWQINYDSNNRKKEKKERKENKRKIEKKFAFSIVPDFRFGRYTNGVTIPMPIIQFVVSFSIHLLNENI